MIGPPKWTKTTLCKYSHSLRSVWRPMDMLFAKAICLKTRAALRRGRAATASTAGTAARKLASWVTQRFLPVLFLVVFCGSKFTHVGTIGKRNKPLFWLEWSVSLNLLKSLLPPNIVSYRNSWVSGPNTHYHMISLQTVQNNNSPTWILWPLNK